MFLERTFSQASHDSLRQKVDIGEQHRQLTELVAKLSQPEIAKAIQEDRLTFGLVRPELHDPLKQNRSRAALLNEMFSMIRQPLRVAYQVSLQLDDQAIEELWMGYSRDSMLKKQSLKKGFENRWEVYKTFMRGGESTVLLLATEQPGAVDAWREHIGHTWEVAKLRQVIPSHLAARFNPFRPRYAPEDPQQAILNNGFHGSSKKEDVARELEVIRQCAQRVLFEQAAPTS